jgi:hypothetical protein
LAGRQCKVLHSEVSFETHECDLFSQLFDAITKLSFQDESKRILDYLLKVLSFGKKVIGIGKA